MGFGKPLRKRKSQIKYKAFYCSEIQFQKFTADKLSCLCWLHNWIIVEKNCSSYKTELFRERKCITTIFVNEFY